MANGQTILIVDSNEGFATLLKESLEREGGHRTTLTTNGEDALQALSSSRYDLAIVDLGLENPAGVALARAMRKQQADLRLMLIPLQGEALSDDVADLDIQGVLPKPFFLPELPDRIADALSRSVKPPAPAPEVAQQAEEAPVEAKATSESAKDTQPVVTNVQKLIVPEQKKPAASQVEKPAATGSDQMAGVRERIPQIMKKMNALAQEVNAAAILLTCKGRLISHTGHISPEEAVGLAQATTENWRTAARIAKILGQELAYFEQSTEGGEYMFYSLAIIEDIILSIAMNTSVPLGMVRHRAKGTAGALRKLLSAG